MYHVVMGLILLLSLGLMVYDLVDIGKFAGNYRFCSPPKGCTKLLSTAMYRKWAAEASFAVVRTQIFLTKATIMPIFTNIN